MRERYSLLFLLPILHVSILLLSGDCVNSLRIIENLPGFDGPLPFKLETGYMAIGEEEEIELFYYFVESERNPQHDPLLVWIAGGPGCSTLRAFFFEIGPLNFEYTRSRGSKPVLVLNPFSWTKVSNVIYLDTPVGAGFSYAKNSDAYKTSDTLSSKHVYDFLRKWVRDHPRLISNPLYIAGVSYSGIVVPIIAQEIYNGNEAGNKPHLNINGYIIGNPLTDRDTDFNSRIPYANRFALLSDPLFQSAKENCLGDYLNPANSLCARDLSEVDECLMFINAYNILEPSCGSFEGTRGASSPLRLLQLQQTGCRTDNYEYNVIWANDENVQRALGIRKGTIQEFEECNMDHYSIGKDDTDTYSYNIANSIAYHRNLTNKSCRALIFSGDHDLVVPHLGTERWVHSLNLTLERSRWAPWFVHQEVAGYGIKFSHENYSLTFATVKGAGHAAPEYKPEECLAMVERWLAHTPL